MRTHAFGIIGAAIILSLLATSCRERQAVEAQAASATERATSPAEASPASEPKITENSARVPAESIREIAGESLAAASPSQASCSFDSVGENYFQGSYALDKSKQQILRGWLSDETWTAAGDFHLLLKGDKQTFSIPARTNVERPDVVKYFKHPGLATAGFNLAADLSDIPDSSYAVVLMFERDGKAIYCNTAKTLVIH